MNLNHQARRFLTPVMFLIVMSAQPVYSDHHGKADSKSMNAAKMVPMNYIDSDKKIYEEMLKLPTDQPLQMLNMIRYKDKAVYPADSEFAAKGWTGEQAYEEYSRHSGPVAARVGGKAIYGGLPQLTVIGPVHEKWDVIFIVHYPNLETFLALVNDPEYKKHAFHRSAAVADSRLVRMAPLALP